MRTEGVDVELDLVVVGREEPVPGVVVLDLQATDGTDLPGWAPGAHVELDLGADLARQYSLCGDPTDTTTWRIGVLLEETGRGGSQQVHRELLVGHPVHARGPRNHFTLEPSPRYVFIAGGIGITPILTMATAAERAGAQWSLVYGGRSLTSMAFRDQLVALGGDRVTLHPQDVHGLIDLPTLLAEPAADTLVYCCGPGPLLDAVEALTADWPAGTLHVERFTARELDEPVRQETSEVECSLSDVVLTVGPDISILDAALAAGLDVPSSCGEGTCGTCETVVVSGAVEHRDALLTPAEREKNETLMICVSRPAGSRLVLEL